MPRTKIECIRRRKGGTVVTLQGVSYRFEPRNDGRHVCDTIENEEHIHRLLKIDAYRLVRDEEVPEVAVPLPPLAPAVIDTPPLQSDDDDVDDSDLDDDEMDEVPEEGTPIEEMTEAQLIEAIARETGKAPHPNSKPETLRTKLAEARAAAAS
ncbi:hypothetical protein [Salipiger sp.]|uniref:hypothetical protein n=1 Tax=Salipiger sp. TaxID=2078585 RepID=UPI003A98429F